MPDRAPSQPGPHPRPQFRRAEWASLGGPWDFALDPAGVWRAPREVD